VRRAVVAWPEGTPLSRRARTLVEYCRAPLRGDETGTASRA